MLTALGGLGAPVTTMGSGAFGRGFCALLGGPLAARKVFCDVTGSTALEEQYGEVLCVVQRQASNGRR